jgi:AraC-like DNA-binding protein
MAALSAAIHTRKLLVRYTPNLGGLGRSRREQSNLADHLANQLSLRKLDELRLTGNEFVRLVLADRGGQLETVRGILVLTLNSLVGILEREQVLSVHRATELSQRFERELENVHDLKAVGACFESQLERLCELSRKSTVADRDERVRMALEWLESHLAVDAPLAEVARRAGLAETSFRRVFRVHFGQSFYRWLSRLRLEESERLIVQTDLTIAAIAKRVGFREIHAFERNFRRTYAMTPREMRQLGQRPKSESL